MSSSIPDLKTSLVNELWLPLAKTGGDQLFPRLKRHKKMKLFTLTDMNCQEVTAFEDNKLTKREDVVVWTHSYLEKIRLETELGRYKEILFEGRFDDVINDESQVILDYFPCDILNLDFSSQKPDKTIGRIEKEINGVNILVSSLNELQSKGFVLLYTTLLDQFDLSLDNLTFSLRTLQSFSNPACQTNDKIEFIKGTVISALHDHNYHINEFKELLFELDNAEKMFSIGVVSLRSS